MEKPCIGFRIPTSNILLHFLLNQKNMVRLSRKKWLATKRRKIHFDTEMSCHSLTAPMRDSLVMFCCITRYKADLTYQPTNGEQNNHFCIIWELQKQGHGRPKCSPSDSFQNFQYIPKRKWMKEHRQECKIQLQQYQTKVLLIINRPHHTVYVWFSLKCFLVGTQFCSGFFGIKNVISAKAI